MQSTKPVIIETKRRFPSSSSSSASSSSSSRSSSSSSSSATLRPSPRVFDSLPAASGSVLAFTVEDLLQGMTRAADAPPLDWTEIYEILSEADRQLENKAADELKFMAPPLLSVAGDGKVEFKPFVGPEPKAILRLARQFMQTYGMLPPTVVWLLFNLVLRQPIELSRQAFILLSRARHHDMLSQSTFADRDCQLLLLHGLDDLTRTTQHHHSEDMRSGLSYATLFLADFPQPDWSTDYLATNPVQITAAHIIQDREIAERFKKAALQVTRAFGSDYLSHTVDFPSSAELTGAFDGQPAPPLVRLVRPDALPTPPPAAFVPTISTTAPSKTTGSSSSSSSSSSITSSTTATPSTTAGQRCKSNLSYPALAVLAHNAGKFSNLTDDQIQKFESQLTFHIDRSFTVHWRNVIPAASTLRFDRRIEKLPEHELANLRAAVDQYDLCLVSKTQQHQQDQCLETAKHQLQHAQTALLETDALLVNERKRYHQQTEESEQVLRQAKIAEEILKEKVDEARRQLVLRMQELETADRQKTEFRMQIEQLEHTTTGLRLQNEELGRQVQEFKDAKEAEDAKDAEDSKDAEDAKEQKHHRDRAPAAPRASRGHKRRRSVDHLRRQSTRPTKLPENYLIETSEEFESKKKKARFVRL